MFQSTQRCMILFILLVLCLPLIGGSGATSYAAPVPPAATGPLGSATIPVGKAITLDGACDDFGDALAQTFSDAEGSTSSVLLKHDGTNLYVCMKMKPGSFKDRFASLYLDPQGDGAGYEFAAKTDYSLRLNILDSARSSYNGTDVANGYVVAPAIDPLWDGKTSTSPNGEFAEYSVSLGRFNLGQCGKLFGIAAYHHWVNLGSGDDYGWPSNEFFDQPRTWSLAGFDSGPCDGKPTLRGKIAYVYWGDTADAVSFYNLLTENGYTVTLVPLGDVLATDFSVFDLTIIADDSGELNSWATPAHVARITAPNKPILGLGEGGYAFFGKLTLYIGWPNGWHGLADQVKRPPLVTTTHYSAPNPIAGDPVTLYTRPVNEVGIYLDPAGVPSDVIPFGLEVPSTDHAPLIFQSCRQLWGFSGNPTAMSGAGQDMFINTVEYARTFQCSPPPPPKPEECLAISKSAEPPAGTTVEPGQVIRYTITYTLSNNPNCQNGQAKIVDVIPPDTIFVPNSADDGIAPGPDGALIWTVSPGGASGTKSFKVLVNDTQCTNQRTVVNQARLLPSVGAPLTSNIVAHPVKCPPIRLPDDQPTYAEREIQINPYPMVTGRPSQVSVRVSNDSDAPQEVTVSFQTSPNRFGIGLDFNTFDTRTVVIPPRSSAIVETTFTPVSSGHYCIQVVVQGKGQRPITSQRNMDVTENLKPGVTDTLTFKVRNNSSAPADVRLVVDNTCPGWNAVVEPAVLSGMAPGEVRDAQLKVTPPDPVALGSECHIDVQGWIGDQLIGGIRKLDVPPVHLPRDVNPPWAEPEISFNPSPLVIGRPGQICVELQNPLSVARNVTLEYAAADFGAGIPFTTVASKPFTLPPNSIANYCADWTPEASGTLHRCVLVTLKQANYADMTSQRNVDLQRVTVSRLPELTIPVRIGNPTRVLQPLELDLQIYGILPNWEPYLIDPLGDPPPDALAPGQTLDLSLRFRPHADAAQSVTWAAPTQASQSLDYRFGDESRVDVMMRLGGVETSGFSVVLETSSVFLPLTKR